MFHTLSDLIDHQTYIDLKMKVADCAQVTNAVKTKAIMTINSRTISKKRILSI